VLQIKYRCSSETFRNNCFLQCPTTLNILKLLESKIKSSLNGFNDVTWCNFRPVPTSWAAIKAQCQLISGRDLIAADYVAQLPQPLVCLLMSFGSRSLPCQDVPRSTSGSGRQWWHPLPKFGRPVDAEDTADGLSGRPVCRNAQNTSIAPGSKL
jgi:hypothetical protein